VVAAAGAVVEMFGHNAVTPFLVANCNASAICSLAVDGDVNANHSKQT
jgi:hypothetical protein